MTNVQFYNRRLTFSQMKNCPKYIDICPMCCYDDTAI